MALDPYENWLGIRPQDQPPTFYRLVGVADFEDNAEVIHAAALARIALLRRHQSGPHGDLSQRLMNEVSQARLALLDSQRKSQYDFELRLRGAESPPPTAQSSRSRLFLLPIGIAILVAVAAYGWFRFAGDGRLANTRDQMVIGQSQPVGEESGKVESNPSPVVDRMAMDPVNVQVPQANANPIAAKNVPHVVAAPPPVVPLPAVPRATEKTPADAKPAATAKPNSSAAKNSAAGAPEKVATAPPPALVKPAEAPAKVALVPPVDPVELSIPVSEFLIVGPVPREAAEDALDLKELRKLVERFRTRRNVRFGQVVDKREVRFGKPGDEGPGIYLLVLPLDVRKSTSISLRIASSPGGALFVLDAKPKDLGHAQLDDLSTSTSRPNHGEPFKVNRGLHAIYGVVNVADESTALRVQLLDDKGKPLDTEVFATFK